LNADVQRGYDRVPGVISWLTMRFEMGDRRHA
jgi:hypothetical protein